MTSNSPTLVQGQRYVSVVADLPPALSGRIRSWQVSHGMPEAVSHGHITVFVGEYPADPSVWDLLEDDAARLGAVQVELGAPSTFLPVSPVSYLAVTGGVEHLGQLHALCSERLGPSASPFSYVPHMTLALNLNQSALEKSIEDFKELPAELASFSVERLRVSSYDGQQWHSLRMLNIA